MPATYDDLLNVPEHLVAELIDGKLYTWPRPLARDLLVQGGLVTLLSQRYRRSGEWWLMMEPEVHLRGDVLVPNLAGWRRSRMPKLPESWEDAVPPDWICEILSDLTEYVDREKKLPVYATAVPWIWLVDRRMRSVEVMDVPQRISNVYTGSEVIAVEPFAEAKIDLAKLWTE